MRITITGGFGFMGSLCADFFRKNGHDVSIVSRKIPAELHKWSKDFRIITGDVTGPLEIGGDLVIHCAALNETKNSGPDEFMKVNADGTRNALESAVRNSAGKFIKLSTFHVYGTTEGTITEETVPDPKSLYAKSQLAADNICMDYSKEIDVSVVRFSNVFGPPLHPSIDRWTLVVNNFCLQAVKNGTIRMNTKGSQKRDFISTQNAMAAIDALVRTKHPSGVFNAGGLNVMSVKEVAERVAGNYEILYRKKIPVLQGDGEEGAGDFIYSLDKIRTLGYNPRNDTDRTIKETLSMCDRL